MSLPMIPNLGADRQVRVPPELRPFMPSTNPTTDGLEPHGVDGARAGGAAGVGRAGTPGAAGADGTPFDSFAKAFEREVDAVNNDMSTADAKIEAFVSGEEHSVHEVMVAMNKADTSFRMLTTITKRVVEAYQEVMRMQV